MRNITTKTADEFHDHLDKCEWCANNPHNLCSVGHELLTGEKPERKPHKDSFDLEGLWAIISAMVEASKRNKK